MSRLFLIGTTDSGIDVCSNTHSFWRGRRHTKFDDLRNLRLEMLIWHKFFDVLQNISKMESPMKLDCEIKFASHI